MEKVLAGSCVEFNRKIQFQFKHFEWNSCHII